MKKYFQAPWNLKDLALIIFIATILMLLTGLALYFLDIENYFQKAENKSLYLIGFFLLQWTVLMIPLIIWTLKKYHLRWQHFGFQKIGIFKTIWLMISAYLFYLAISFIISVIIIYWNLKIPGYQVQKSLIPFFGTDLFSLIITAIVMVIFAPLVEEIFFRGFLLRTLSNKIGTIYGSILSAAVFAMLHIPWETIIPIFILGLIINYLVIKSKSLWPAIAFHILNNAVVFSIEILLIKNIISIEPLT